MEVQELIGKVLKYRDGWSGNESEFKIRFVVFAGSTFELIGENENESHTVGRRAMRALLDKGTCRQALEMGATFVERFSITG